MLNRIANLVDVACCDIRDRRKAHDEYLKGIRDADELLLALGKMLRYDPTTTELKPHAAGVAEAIRMFTYSMNDQRDIGIR